MDIANGSLLKPNNWSLINREKKQHKKIAGQSYQEKHIFFVKFVLPISKETLHLLYMQMLQFLPVFLWSSFFKFSLILQDKVCKFVNDVLLFLICVKTITTVQED